MELFGKLGLTHVFYSLWFIGLLCILAATVAVCSTRRFTTVLRTNGYARYRAFGSMLTHISILLILTGGVIRGVWGEKGYIELREGETNAQFVTEKSVKPLPFGIHLAKFEIETYDQAKMDADGKAQTKQGDCCNALLVAWPEKNLKATLPVKVGEEQAFAEFKITILKYIPDFIVDMQTHEITSRSSEPRNPAILVAVNGPTYQNHRWLFAKFPDFTMHTKDTQATGPSPLEMVYQNHGVVEHKTMPTGPIKSFKSTIQLVEGESVVGERTVEVNSPFHYKGYTFYQSGYNPDDLSYTSFQVVKDRGVPVVYTGFALMIAGLFLVFYLNPWFDARGKAA
jgi:cytochrome c biogenesis protein ResB